MKKLFTILLLIVPIAIGFAGGTKEKQEGVVVFALDATWPPMEFVDTDSGEVVGFTVDLVRAIAQEEGFGVSFQTVSWSGIFAGLTKGDYDGISSSVTITEERKKTMAFSDAYFNAGQMLAINKKLAGKVNSLTDLVGKEVGAQIGTTGANEVAKHEGVILKTYDALGPAVEELANETLDGIVADTPLIADYLLKNKRYAGLFITVGEPMTTEEYGFVFTLENTELLNKMNSGLAKVKASGEYDKIYAKWID